MPTIGQIGSLVFGFVRNKQIKICKAQAALKSDITVEDEDETHSRTSVSQTGTESYFDPPVENYKFIYQNDTNGMGFVLSNTQFGSSVLSTKKVSRVSVPDTLTSADAPMAQLARSQDSIQERGILSSVDQSNDSEQY